MSHPVVSVIIPTYNRTDYLRLTIESVLNQTFQNFEILVIDDGSPNEDNAILCAQYEKVTYTKIENSKGPSKPRNYGIKSTKGKYIAFLDDDDIWLPNKLEKQLEILENNPDFGLVHGCCAVIDENGILQNQIVGRPGSPNVKHGDVSLRMIGNWTVMMPTSFVRKEIIDKVGFFNEEMPAAGEDMEFWVRSSFLTKFYYIDEPLVQYRIHSQNISSQNSNYLQLPLHLKKVLIHQKAIGRITKKQYELLLNNLCKMQIKSVKQDFWITLKNLFSIDSLWIIRKNNLKTLLYLQLKK